VKKNAPINVNIALKYVFKELNILSINVTVALKISRIKSGNGAQQ
tara:strand:- start:328 stop:462 length:135 start_codon:yes stop_codon:yes gene_type:complete